MLIPFDILLLEWCEHFRLGHPISNVIMVKLTVLNQKLEQVHIQQLCILEHQGLPLPSINCHIILFSHVFLLLHKTISYHFPHNCPEGSKVFLVPLFANFVIFFYQVSQTITDIYSQNMWMYPWCRRKAMQLNFSTGGHY